MENFQKVIIFTKRSILHASERYLTGKNLEKLLLLFILKGLCKTTLKTSISDCHNYQDLKYLTEEYISRKSQEVSVIVCVDNFPFIFLRHVKYIQFFRVFSELSPYPFSSVYMNCSFTYTVNMLSLSA